MDPDVSRIRLCAFFSLACCSALALLLAPNPLLADTGDLDRALEDAFRDTHVPGAAVAVVRSGALVHTWYHGVADLETQRPVTRDTVFRAGSVSKNVTSLIAVRLMQAGLIEPESKVAPLLPKFKLDNPWSADHPLQVRHLLQHTGGLPGSSYAEYAANRIDAAPGDYLEWLGDTKLRWPPGIFYSYANPGHTIVAALLERITGESFDQLAQRHVFSPLQMASASFATFGKQPAAMATSYDARRRVVPSWEMLIRPSGSLSATVVDLAKLVALYTRRGRLADGRSWLDATWLTRMEQGEAALAARISPGAAAYGWGNFCCLIDGRYFRGHWGKTEAFRTNMGYRPDHADGFVIVANATDEGAMEAARIAIVRFLADAISSPSVPDIPLRTPEIFPGHYISVGHEMPLRGWLFRGLNQCYIRASEEIPGAIAMTRRTPQSRGACTLYPVDAGFAHPGTPHATAVFADYDGDKYWLNGGPFKRVSMIEALFWRYLPGIALVAGLLALAQGGWLLVARIRNGQSPGYPGIQITGMLGVLLTAVLFVGYGLLGSAGEQHQFGTLGLVSMATAVASLVGGGCALVLPVIVWVSRSTQPGWQTALGMIVALPVHILAWVWLVHGWIPLIPWLR
jgi:CubicO group peptidase (beta-lactamase class C family)